MDNYELGEVVAQLWSPALGKRFPGTSHTTCFQAMRIINGQQWPAPYDPPRCQDWHCPRCGAPTNMYGHHTTTCTTTTEETMGENLQ